jgi:hypothetical protein
MEIPIITGTIVQIVILLWNMSDTIQNEAIMGITEREIKNITRPID